MDLPGNVRKKDINSKCKYVRRETIQKWGLGSKDVTFSDTISIKLKLYQNTA